MSIESIYLQQTEKLIQSTALRKAATSPAPPKLSEDESAMISKKFTASKPLENYTSQGKIQRDDFFGRGLNIDKRI